MIIPTPITSRRSLLASVVVAAAAIPSMQPAQSQQLDAELLAYGREIDAFIRDYKITCAKYRPLWDEMAARMRCEMPLDNETPLDFRHRVYNEVGLDALDRQGDHPDDIMNRLDAPSRAIIAIPARTLAGLAVKARLAKFSACEMWDASDEDVDWDHLALRSFVDAVLELAATNSNLTGDAA